MKMIPLDDRCVVKPEISQDKTPGGIVLPDRAKEKQHRGEVLAVGPGRYVDSGERLTMSVKVGDVVIFNLYGGADVEIDGEELKILRESEILAVLK